MLYAFDCPPPHPRLASVLAAGLVLLSLSPVALGADGIFSDFTTSLGTFTCELRYEEAPRTVANFIGLATGQRPWLEVATGTVRARPFYDGTTFHRVIRGFMIQGGSPNGLGTDGPGYVVKDEFNAALRHDSAGVLSMANSGPDSNGSQFFVTVASTPHLDDVHTVFGRVVAGLEVVTAISEVATGSRNDPLQPVVVESVTIRRIGQAAQAFDIQAQSLPEVSGEPLAIEPRAGQADLRFAGQLYADLYLTHSTDLGAWSSIRLGLDLREPAQAGVTVSTAGAAQFFSLSRVAYAGSTRAPRLLDRSHLNLRFSRDFGNGLTGELSITFGTGGQGTYAHNGVEGTVTTYTWEQAVYRGYLWPVFFSEPGSAPLTLVLSFRSETEGSFTGSAYPQGGSPVRITGSFSLQTP